MTITSPQYLIDSITLTVPLYCTIIFSRYLLKSKTFLFVRFYKWTSIMLWQKNKLFLTNTDERITNTININSLYIRGISYEYSPNFIKFSKHNFNRWFVAVYNVRSCEFSWLCIRSKIYFSLQLSCSVILYKY